MHITWFLMATMLKGTFGKYILKDEEDTDPDSMHSCCENIIYILRLVFDVLSQPRVLKKPSIEHFII